MTTLELLPGVITTRAELRSAFGGSLQGGIVPIRDAKMVLVFSDPAAGAQHGYTFDGQAEDDERGTLYLYTGAGTTGHQKLNGLNGSLLRHREMGRTLHLFVADGRVPGTGTVRQRYIGEVAVDEERPYEERWSAVNTAEADSEGSAKARRLYVFRFRPAEGATLALTSKDVMQPAPKTETVEIPAPEEVPSADSGSTAVATEQHATDQTVAHVIGGQVAVQRREGQLTRAFQEHLAAAGHTYHRYQITVEGVPGSLMTDVYDATDNVLYEAKGHSRRNDIRLAMGQLFDYRRHVKTPPGLRLALLLPDDPGKDLRDLLAAERIHLVVQNEEGFDGFPLQASDDPDV